MPAKQKLKKKKKKKFHNLLCNFFLREFQPIVLIVNDIHLTVNFFEDISFSFVKREVSSSTHLLAFRPAFWHRSGPVPLSWPPAINVA